MSASAGPGGETVTIPQGAVRGVSGRSGSVRSFLGLPYAAAPVGDLRWRPPQDPASWQGLRSATSYGPNPPQFELPVGSHYRGGHENQNEDCLYLNVYAPANASGLPTMVWFHLGGFQFGSGSVSLYNGQQLALSGVVVVTVNYRLGRLGFLAHPDLTAESDASASGNYGLQDAIKALEWVAASIDAFGGDPTRVTVFGLSAGSMIGNLLMTSPAARGLFHRVIGQSGSFFGPTAKSSGFAEALQTLGSAEESGRIFADALGATSLEDMRNRSAQEIISVPPLITGCHWNLQPVPEAPAGPGMFDSSWPVVDGWVIPEEPFEVFRRGEQADVPIIVGSVDNEANGMPGLGDAEAATRYADAEFGAAASEFRRLFPFSDGAGAYLATSRANGDRCFIWQNWTWARMHAATANAPTYYYNFQHAPPASVSAGVSGAFHGAETIYAFRNLGERAWPWAARDHELARQISGYWSNFAADGDPNADGLPVWSPLDVADPRVLLFGEHATSMGAPQRPDHMAFWDTDFARRRGT